MAIVIDYKIIPKQGGFYNIKIGNVLVGTAVPGGPRTVREDGPYKTLNKQW